MGIGIKGPNDVVLGRYVIDAVIERMEVVYLLHDRKEPGRRYCAKRVHPRYSERADILDWFSRQAKVWQQVTARGHRHLVRLVEPLRIDTDSVCYFFTEFVHGDSLATVIRRTPGARLSYPQTLRWAIQIAAAMEHASNPEKNGFGSFVHRDLESSNIIIARTGEAKVNDWGLGRDLLEPDDQISVISIEDFRGPAIGKAPYMPPEQFPPLRGRTYRVPGDVYYLGGLVYEMLTGNGVNPRAESAYLQKNAKTEDEVRRAIEKHQAECVIPTLAGLRLGEGLVGLVARCIAPDAQRRYPSFTPVLARLLELAADVRAGGVRGPFSACRACGFIPATRQTTCPVCGEAESLTPWAPSTFTFDESEGPAWAREVESGRGAAVEAASLSPIDVASPAPAPRMEPKPAPAPPEPRPKAPRRGDPDLIVIPTAQAVLGAAEDVVERIRVQYGLEGDSLRQIASPPAHCVTVRSFAIGRTAVSVGEYREFVQATGWPATPDWSGDRPSGREDLPVVNVSFADAESYCQWRGVRLPTNDEWERAARGKDGLTYPWGDTWPREGTFRCHTLERHQATGEATIPVGAMAEYASPEGCVGMVGNVWEWVDGGEGNMKHTRGGSWRYQGDVYGPSWFRLPTDPAITQDDVGFRVAADHPARAMPEAPAEKWRETVAVPAGRYMLGLEPARLEELARRFGLSPSDVAKLGREPGRVASIHSLYISKYPVTNEEYWSFVQATDHPWPSHWSRHLLRWAGRPFLAKYRFHPVTNVTLDDAETFCRGRGGRLPTGAEWEAAARGDTGRLYPWGDLFEAGRCNTKEAGQARTTHVDAYPLGASPFGALDMVGNVQEWAAREPGGAAFVRGGSYRYPGALYGLVVLAVQADTDIKRDYVGFRCAFD